MLFASILNLVLLFAVLSVTAYRALRERRCAAAVINQRHLCSTRYEVFTRSSKRPANFQQMYSEYA